MTDIKSIQIAGAIKKIARLRAVRVLDAASGQVPVSVKRAGSCRADKETNFRPLFRGPVLECRTPDGLPLIVQHEYLHRIILCTVHPHCPYTQRPQQRRPDWGRRKHTMDDFEGSYAPQSPDLSGLNGFEEPQPTFTTYVDPQSQYRASFNQPPAQHNPYGFSQPRTQPTDPYHYSQPPRNGQPVHPHHIPTATQSKTMSAQKGVKKSKEPELIPVEEPCDKLAPGVEEGIEVKTKFPVARIKRIMQADEDVGKVAQVTPTAVCECAFHFLVRFSN